MIFPKSYVVFDFETSGLDPATCKIIEIGALRVIEGKPAEQLSWLVDWGKDFVVPELITQITGINASMLSLGHKPPFAWYDFREFTRGLPMIGHNILKFDIPFLLQMDKFINDNNATFKGVSLMKNCIDTAGLFKAKKLGFSQNWNETLNEFCLRALDTRAAGVKFNVQVACDELGISRANAIQHRAEGDVMLTNEIYKKLCLQN